MDFLDGLDAHWAWITLGLVLGAMEMLVPGVYLMWLAIAALITGLMTYVLDIPLSIQIVNFVFLSLIAAFSARRWLHDSPIVSSDPLLNRRVARLVGQTAVVSQAIEHGSGRIHLGDSDWIAQGPDMDVGERVRVTGSDGSALLVEPLNLIKALPQDEGDPAL